MSVPLQPLVVQFATLEFTKGTLDRRCGANLRRASAWPRVASSMACECLGFTSALPAASAPRSALHSTNGLSRRRLSASLWIASAGRRGKPAVPGYINLLDIALSHHHYGASLAYLADREGIAVPVRNNSAWPRTINVMPS